nr:hypothetical protein 2 [bacterium]
MESQAKKRKRRRRLRENQHRLRPKRTGTGKDKNGTPRSGVDVGLYPVRTARGTILTNYDGVRVDLRTRLGQRWLDKLNSHFADKGGRENCTTAEHDLILSASALGVILETMTADYLTGAKFDAQIFATIAEKQCRILTKLGIHRRARDITPPDPLDYARTFDATSEEVDGDED